jgi:hypothetical protein
VRGVGVVVHYGLVAAAWNVGVSFDGGVVVMMVTGIIVLHTLKRGEPKLSPSLKDESSPLSDSSRMECSNNDPLWGMPPNTVLESLPLLETDPGCRSG